MDPWRKVRAAAEASTSLGELALLELGEHAGSPRQTVLNALRERAVALLPDASEADRADARVALADVPGSTVLAVIEGRPPEVADDDEHGALERGPGGQPSMPSTPEPPPPEPTPALAEPRPVVNHGRVVGRLTRNRVDGVIITGMTGQRRR